MLGMVDGNGQRIVYHTCGGMMPLLERIAAMQPDAMETFTPRAMPAMLPGASEEDLLDLLPHRWRPA